jgi:demethylmenaquinone methyltransferase/2-methoxy-6-polyprenyl-1,4-benzoquinol methylase
VTAQFSLRNMEDWRAGLQEMTRVTREGGRLVILEVVQPTTGLGSVALKLLDLTTHVLLFRRLSPYRWLGRSLLHAPTAVELEEEISRRGWVTVGRRRWLGDLVVLLTAERAGSDSGIVSHTASRLRVVWATDGSPTAMAAGEWLVRHIERPAVVHVVTVSPPLGAGDRATLGATDLRAWERALRQAAALLPTSRFVVIPRLLEGDPSTELLRYGATIKPDLMVVGLKRRSPGAARLMGHVGEDLAAKADWPVLAVPLPTWPDARADGEESARQHDADGTGSHGHGGGMDDADGDR